MCKWLREWQGNTEESFNCLWTWKSIKRSYQLFWCNRTEGRGGNRNSEAKLFSLAPRVRSNNRYRKFHFHLNKNNLGFFIFRNIQIPAIQGPASLGLVDLTLRRDFCLETSRSPFHPQPSYGSMDDSASLWKSPDNKVAQMQQRQGFRNCGVPNVGQRLYKSL